MIDYVGHKVVILYHRIAAFDVTEFELAEPDLTLFGLVVACLVAYLGLMGTLGDTLGSIGDHVRGKAARDRLYAINSMAGVLRIVTGISGVLLLATTAHMYMPLIPPDFAESYQTGVEAMISLWTPVSVLFLAVCGSLVGNLVYRFKRENAENACKMWEAVVHLKCGRALTGTIYDFGFLTNSSQHLALCRRDLTLDVIALAEIAAVFLQPEYDQADSIRTLQFRPAKRTLTLTTPHVEPLPARRQFVGDRFTVLELSKPTTTARFAIVQSDCLSEA